MFFSRLTNLFKGKFTRWLKRREARDPEAVYEAAIADRVKRYQQLKTAAAGVIYMRTKLERELKEKSRELAEVEEQAGQAADLNEDQCALILIRRKHELEAEVARLREDLTQLTTEAEGAKQNLIAFKGEIEKLKAEKVTMVARLRNAQARIRITRALEELPYEEDLRALAEVRESIQQALAEAGRQSRNPRLRGRSETRRDPPAQRRNQGTSRTGRPKAPPPPTLGPTRPVRQRPNQRHPLRSR